MGASGGPHVFESPSAAAGYLAPLRAGGRTLVTTNGCFDLLHAGHVQYLYEAAARGDLLAVGVNCDEVVRRLKGEGRPVQPEGDRAAIIGALEMVDCAFVFHEGDPCAFLRLLRPEIHVKGGDYTVDIVEKPVVESYGGRIEIVSFRRGLSTSALIEAIRGSRP
jgi:D-beta-D-heptose 7-phosphate kinase/D-beta-D-heptose 1-phosphate adenosyltransferase